MSMIILNLFNYIVIKTTTYHIYFAIHVASYEKNVALLQAKSHTIKTFPIQTGGFSDKPLTIRKTELCQTQSF